jgi:hypothetical protein
MKWLAFLHLTISFVTPFGLYYNSFWYNNNTAMIQQYRRKSLPDGMLKIVQALFFVPFGVFLSF